MPGVLAILLVSAMIVALVVTGGGLFGTSVTVSSDEGVAAEWTPPPADGSYGVVVGSYKAKDGLGLLGIEFTPSRWEAQVMFVPPAGCEPTEEQDIVAAGACSGVPAEGRLGGGGTTADGDTLWTVVFEVSKACHEALNPNDRWPNTTGACR